ncbi:ABC transporter substrate-binding protein [Endozoicomonas sp. SM1973]|uniref:ABC transporter substrate-binding protein n=1 Tax=Spartinivicinus marinus TaxID=2994442 RepID=A0A853HT51_9GAMM|nr:ABC transporter substrate-binding protein [Spartinivicinus marinus]MCX4026639.1 ABC transporter substrate-binding protein [Spartinivicinus marinus]NYZ64473.1 ABC transporter substrate-binding protein [Spartinivicinus marinus]
MSHFVKALFTAFFLLVVTTKAYCQPIHLLTNPFPPLHMTVSNNGFGKDENVTGLATEIINQLFTRSNIKYTITLQPSAEESQEIATHNNNYGVFTTFKTKQSQHIFKWVGPLFEEDWIILAPKNKRIVITQLSDLHKYRIGSYEQDEISKYLIKNGVKLIKAKGDVVNAAKLKLGKIDLWATSSLSGPVIAKRYSMHNLEVVYTFNRSALWLALNKNISDDTVSTLNTNLNQLRSEGFINSVVKKYSNPGAI